MRPPSIEVTKQLILKAVSASGTEEELGLCKEIIERFVLRRFKHYANSKDLCLALNEMDSAIEEQRTKILTGVFELETLKN